MLNMLEERLFLSWVRKATRGYLGGRCGKPREMKIRVSSRIQHLLLDKTRTALWLEIAGQGKTYVDTPGQECRTHSHSMNGPQSCKGYSPSA